MILLLAAPAGAAQPRDPAGPPPRRDTVIEAPSAASARISSAADAARYPIGDGSGETVAIAVTAGAFEAIREDTLRPWPGRSAFGLRGRLPQSGEGPALRAFRTPLDGMVSLRPAGRPRYELDLLNPAGRVLRTSRRDLSFGHRLNFTVCGQSRLRLAVRGHRRPGGAYEVQIQRP